MRIIAAISVGVSYVAAGTIVQRGCNVRGIARGTGLVLAIPMITFTVVGWIEARFQRQ